VPEFIQQEEKPMNVEIAVPLDSILRILGWSRAKFFNKKEELHNCGAIFYINQGRPPRKRIYAFPSRLRNWISLKSSKGEII
jgi:hypothetical protein